MSVLLSTSISTKMIKLYPLYEAPEMEIDYIPILLKNLHEFLAPVMNAQEEIPLNTMAMRICKWQDVPDSDTYLSITLLVDLNSIDDFKLRVEEGYDSSLDGIIEGDGFVDIKTDNVSIQQAILHIKNETVPLHNRVDRIDYALHPYIRGE